MCMKTTLEQIQTDVMESRSALRAQEVAKRDRKPLWMAVPRKIDRILRIYKDTMAAS